MRTRKMIIALLALAALQAAAILILGRSPAVPATSVSPATAAAPAPSVNTRSHSKPVLPLPAIEASSFRWASLESTNYLEFIANLRAFRVPEGTIRDIIVADVNKLFAPLEAPLKATMSDVLSNRTDFAARRAAVLARAENSQKLRNLQREKSTLLKALLGTSLPQDFPSVDTRTTARFSSALSALPPEKREAVRTIQESFWLGSEMLRGGPNRRGPEATATLQRLKSERATQLAAVLSPAELEEFEMRTSPIGVELTESLADFQPTESEYREIFRIRQRVDEPDPTSAKPSAAAREQKAEEQIKTVLGETRYAEYVRSQDPSYQELKELGERYGMPKEVIVRGYEALDQFRKQEEKINDDESITPEQQQQALQSLRARLDKTLTETFGNRAARAFKRQSDLFLDSSEEGP